MHRLSSNTTLFLKIFVPVFWTTILSGLTLVSWFAEAKYFRGIPLTSFRWAMLFTLIMSILLFFFLFWPLKRVETDGEKVFVSNYFRTAFYHWDRDVERVTTSRILLFKIATIELNGIGSFGRRMRFIPSRKLMQSFRESHPGVMKEEQV